MIPKKASLAAALIVAAFANLPCEESAFQCRFLLGGGYTAGRNEQFSPLTLSGSHLKLEGGWSLRGESLMWNGDLSYSMASVTSSAGGSLTVKPETIAIRTGLLYSLPIRPYRTRISIGPSVEGRNAYISSEHNYDIDETWYASIGLGPSVLIENSSIDRWTFRSSLFVPITSWVMSPSWRGHWRDYPENGTLDRVVSSGSWESLSDFLVINGSVSAAYRVARRAELIASVELDMTRCEIPLPVRSVDVSVLAGVEVDLGRKR